MASPQAESVALGVINAAYETQADYNAVFTGVSMASIALLASYLRDNGIPFTADNLQVEIDKLKNAIDRAGAHALTKLDSQGEIVEQAD